MSLISCFLHYLFEKEYSDMKDVKSNIDLIQYEKFHLLSNFTLPESAWLESYYLPMEEELSRLKEKYRWNKVAMEVFKDFTNEINFYKKYSQFYTSKKEATVGRKGS